MVKMLVEAGGMELDSYRGGILIHTAALNYSQGAEILTYLLEQGGELINRTKEAAPPKAPVASGAVALQQRSLLGRLCLPQKRPVAPKSSAEHAAFAAPTIGDSPLHSAIRA